MIDDWKEGLSRSDLVGALSDISYHELESWFNASTFYCDSCVDEFIKNWPVIYNRDMDFQRNAISLDAFYDGTRVREFFTEDEFFDLFRDISCPNCNDSISGFIWPYDLRFEPPANFLNDMCEIAIFAEQTPFLLLSHPFALQVYNEIKTISKTITASNLPRSLFRARRYVRKKTYVIEDFLASQKALIVEGRYNHAGSQVLYLAEDKVTCYYEIRLPEEGIMLAEVEVSVPLKVLDLMDENLEDNNIIQAIQWSSLLSSPDEGEGWHKPHYVFTRFISDVVKAAGVEAIRYPSIRFNQGFNIVIINYEKIKNSVKIIDFEYVSKDEIMSMSKSVLQKW